MAGKIFLKKSEKRSWQYGSTHAIIQTQGNTHHTTRGGQHGSRSPQQKPMGSRERRKADHQDQPQPRPVAVRTLYQGARQQKRTRKSTPPSRTYHPAAGEIKKTRQDLPDPTGPARKSVTSTLTEELTPITTTKPEERYNYTSSDA